jgi:hypothetical protein
MFLNKMQRHGKWVIILLSAASLASVFWQLQAMQLQITSLDDHIAALNSRLKFEPSCPTNAVRLVESNMDPKRVAALVAGQLAREKPPAKGDAKPLAMETRQQQDDLAQAAEAEVTSLVSGMLNRETTYEEWLAIGASIAMLEPEAFRELVTQRVLGRVNKQELKPPKEGSVFSALEGMQIAPH